jgi:hypothetical protein
MIVLLGATPDIVADAYRTDIALTESERGAGASVFCLGIAISDPKSAGTFYRLHLYRW